MEVFMEDFIAKAMLAILLLWLYLAAQSGRI
jgi:hypothetical protein